MDDDDDDSDSVDPDSEDSEGYVTCFMTVVFLTNQKISSNSLRTI